jgi:streptogramin lyase
MVAGALALPAAPAVADLVGPGGPIPNTSSSDIGAQLSGDAVGQHRAEPFFPAANSPTALAALGSTGSPEDDLGDALDRLAAAPDDAAATSAITDALTILEGTGSCTAGSPDEKKAYCGIPLLNYNAPAKVKTVPANGTVDVTEVRFGDHAITDTWLLDFADPSQPFTIRWHISELGTSFGGQLSPAPLLQDGGARIGGHSVVWPLELPNLLTGTTSHSRFHPGGADEETRLATQDLTVRMPPAGMVSAILDPNIKPGHETFAQLAPATAGRLATVRSRFGFDPAQTLAAQRDALIGKLADDSPEKQIWTALKGLGAGTPAFSLAAAHAVGTDDRSLVAAMRSRYSIPSGVAAGDPTAQITVVLMNDEAYISRRSLRLPSGAPVKISVINRDNLTHGFQAVALSARNRVFGALDWGDFSWTPLDVGAGATIAAGATATVTVAPSDSAFALWLGDPDLGDQAGMSIELDRGPKVQSIPVGGPFAVPAHGVSDKQGNIWVTLLATDSIAKITPADDLAASQIQTFPIAGGQRTPGQPPIFAPSDLVIDGQGILWAALTSGNAILRIDPAQVQDGTGNGMKILRLPPCDTTCRPPLVPPTGPEPITRVPAKLKVVEEGNGNTLVVFTEANADAIGVMRVSANGTPLDQMRVPCDCTAPEGLVLDGDGGIWFTEIVNNRIGHLQLDMTRPFNPPGLNVEHYKIPSAIDVFTPGLALCSPPACTGFPNPLHTSEPLSMQIDPAGRVWFTEAEAQKVAFIDPAQARNGTSDGITELQPPVNDFHRLASPSDLGQDRAGTMFFADEYGDIIGRMTASGQHGGWRTPERQSLPEIPFTDTRGDLWFVEVGAAQLTRISGVTAGALVPAPPPAFTFDTRTGQVRADGLRDVSSIDVKVLRHGSDIAHSLGVPVSGGHFETTPGALQGDDRVLFVPHGQFARAPFSFPVADLRATIAPDGSVTGRALHGGAPLGDSVRVGAGGSATPAINQNDGNFSVPASAGLNRAAPPGTVSWAAGTPSGVFRTVTPLDGAVAPGTTNKPAADCGKSVWLTRTGTGRSVKRTVSLLGKTRAQVRSCLGKPTKIVKHKRTKTRRAPSERWTYKRSADVTFTNGRVTSYTLVGRTARSVPDKAGVGTQIASFRKALGRVVRIRHTRTHRAVVALGGGRYADVRIVMDPKRSVAKTVRVTLARLAGLDRVGRDLARSPR